MGLAIPFRLNNDIWDERATEFNIEYNDTKDNFNKLIEFVTLYPNHRINIEFINNVDVEKMIVLSKVHNNISVRLKGEQYFSINKLKEKNVKFFIDKDTMPAINYTTLDSLITLGVSDVYIYDDLCYNLKDVSNLLKSKNIQSRLVLNRIPASTFDKGMNKKSPIYRPQDFELLNEYFDVFEFDCGRPYDWNMFIVLYNHWFDKHDWYGDLREINLDLQFEFPNRSIFPNCSHFKSSCEQKCYKRVNQKCNKCEQFIDMGIDLAKKQIMIKQ